MARIPASDAALAEAPSDAPAKPKRRRSHPHVPAIKRVRDLLARLPLKRRRLVVEQIAWEIQNELRAVAQDAALDAAMGADRADA